MLGRTEPRARRRTFMSGSHMLTSRERVIAAINHRESDRVPMSLTITEPAYRSLVEFLDLSVQEPLSPSSFTEVRPSPEVLRRLNVDLTYVRLSSPRNKRGFRAGDILVDEWGLKMRKVMLPDGGFYFEDVDPPLASATIDDLEDYPWPDPTDPGWGEGVEETARRLYQESELALMGRFGGPVWETAYRLRGYARFLKDLVVDRDFANALLGKVCQLQIAFDKIGITAAGRYLQILKVSGEDLGIQTGPLMSPETFRSVIKPWLAKRWRAARQEYLCHNPEGKVMLHSCGSVRAFIPDFIECGIEILDPVQVGADGMDPNELKKEFGDRLVFHGGIDTQRVLPYGSLAEIEKEVREKIRAFAPGGGYILAPVHNVQADVPPESLVAVYRAGEAHGTYPIRS